MKKTITALVPMRHESERVPGKNYRLFAGRPLYEVIITSLLNCPSIGKIIVNTDSPVIMDGLKRDFPEVNLIKRPENLCDGLIPMNDIILYDLQHTNSNYILQTHATNPLLCPQTIEKAIKLFFEKYPEFDSLFSVTKISCRFWDENIRPLNHDTKKLLRTQDLPPIYEENSCLYLFTKESFQLHNNRIGTNPLMFQIKREEAFDIDEEIDFIISECVFRKLGGK